MSRVDQTREHYEKVWGNTLAELDMTDELVEKLPSDFTIFIDKPSGRRNLWTWATAGFSSPCSERSIEIHVFCKTFGDVIGTILCAAANYHNSGESLGLGHTVNFGCPWYLDSQCSYGYLSLPYLDGLALEQGVIGGQKTRFLWLIPITPKELDFKIKNGEEELERLFESSKFDFANPSRNSLI